MDHELSLRKGDLFPSKKLRNTLIKLRELTEMLYKEWK